MTRPLSPLMLEALRDIAARYRGTRETTERALRQRGLIQDSDSWPFVEITPAGLLELEPGASRLERRERRQELADLRELEGA